MADEFEIDNAYLESIRPSVDEVDYVGDVDAAEGPRRAAKKKKALLLVAAVAAVAAAVGIGAGYGAKGRSASASSAMTTTDDMTLEMCLEKESHWGGSKSGKGSKGSSSMSLETSGKSGKSGSSSKSSKSETSTPTGSPTEEEVGNLTPRPTFDDTPQPTYEPTSGGTDTVAKEAYEEVRVRRELRGGRAKKAAVVWGEARHQGERVSCWLTIVTSVYNPTSPSHNNIVAAV